MLTLVVRRAVAQRRLVAAVVALVAVAATLVGVCALLLGPTQDRAFSREVQRYPAQDVDVDAFLVDLSAADLADVRELVVGQLREILTSLDPTVVATATSRVRDLEDPGAPDGSATGVGYLATGDGIVPRADLTAGRWPTSADGTTEAALPTAAARRLGLAIGDRVGLGRATGTVGSLDPLTLTVVGTFRPRSPAGWESDLLAGAGFDPAYRAGSETTAAYGPFVVDDAAFVASGTPVARLRVSAHPDLALADRTTIGSAVAALGGATGRLTARVGDRVEIARVTSALPATLEHTEARQAAGRATVLVAVLLGAVLALVALLLAGRLVAAVRDEERAWLVALGSSPRQQLIAAGAEALLLAAVAALVALPASVLLHAWLTHAAGPVAAGLAQPPTPTGGLVLAVLGSALALVPALALTGLDPATSSLAARRRWALARSGADVTLLAVAAALAVLAWRQLASQPARAPAPGDVVLIVAPVVCLVATTAVVVRLVPAMLHAASRAALRARTLVLPLSTQQAARRPQPGTAMVLVAATVAAATFGLGLRSTWEQSQADQAALRVGTDLSLALATTPATAADARAVADASDGAAMSPVIDRPLTLGGYVGDADTQPVLVAIDSRKAGAVLRGRTGGSSWATVGTALDPGPAVAGLTFGDGATLRGRATSALPVSATVTAVVDDGDGLRRSIDAAPVALDDRPHALVWQEPLDAGLHLVALSLHLTAPPLADGDAVAVSTVDVTATLRLPGLAPTSGAGSEWHTRAQRDSLVTSPEVSVVPGPGRRTRLRASATVDAVGLSETGADVVTTAFGAPDRVPVAVSADLADTLGVAVGGDLAGVVGDAELPLRVIAVVPTVPSAPGRLAVLADADTVSRGLVAAGDLGSAVDRWWLGDPGPQAARALRKLGLGTVVTRTEATSDLARAPLQVTVPTMLTTLVVAAVVLLLAGVGLVTGGDQRRRAAELTRLRALGLPRGGARRLQLAEHAAFLGPLVLLGVGLGAGATAVLAPVLVRSDLGAAPVPEALAVWPWTTELLLVGIMVVGSAVVTAAFVAQQVRRSDTAGLRTGDA